MQIAEVLILFKNCQTVLREIHFQAQNGVMYYYYYDPHFSLLFNRFSLPKSILFSYVK